MPDAEELEAVRRVATVALAELSRHDISCPTSPPGADLPALLRRCLQLLPLLNAGNPSLATRFCRRLHGSLGAILSRDPCPALLPLLEVLVNFLLIFQVLAECLCFSDRLRSCLAMADCTAHHLVLELVCRHFISSLQYERGFEVFLGALSWSENESPGTPEISFRGALKLIDMTCLFSVPAVIESHLLLLASRCISDQDLDSHLLAFECSMDLYVRYLPELHVFNRTGGVKTPWTVKKKPLSYCIKDTTDQKLRSQINELLSFCQLHSGDGLPSDESDIDRLIADNQHILHENMKQESTLVLKNLLSDILCCAKQKEVLESDTELSDGIFCLAAVLRVMSSSLLHILHCFRQIWSAGDKINGNYAKLCNAYKFIYESVHLLGQHEANELHRYEQLHIMGIPMGREMASMLMLPHFAILSVCCLRRRLGFLWNGCMVMMIMSMNLIAEGTALYKFMFSIDDVPKESAVFCNTNEIILEVPARTRAIALQYETIHKIHKRRHIDGDGSSLVIHQSKSRKANGQAFLECHPQYSPEWNDIVDFVECEEGKDYTNTLKQQSKFRMFKYKKWDSKRQSIVESTKDALGLNSRRLFG
ncbi:hypothetical protein HU200_010613 [Digitaria exilis]|uniref:DUF7812 domain-containing protein n=1 Tax=Digitaria exilis TaxID=1010633 RepID=A0A835FHV7_9POAL|nr:hypothetical protein HU200_010613 [Digitaria exilis]